MSEVLTRLPLNDLAERTPLAVVAGGDPIVLVRIGDEVFALADRCSHADVALSEGEVEDCSIECWLHGSAFDLRTGNPLTPPASTPVRTYSVRITDGPDGSIVEISAETSEKDNA